MALAVPFLGYDLALVRGDALSRLFATVFALMAFAGALFALNQDRDRRARRRLLLCRQRRSASPSPATYQPLRLLGADGGLLHARRLERRPFGRGAGMRYAAIHILGGVLLMAGIAGEIADDRLDRLRPDALDSVPRWLILAGFLVNAGAPPLSAWLPDAYPESSWSGMVFLSAFTTKAAVYVLMRGFPGTELLIYVGLFMVFYGIIYAILENDMRRILAYSIVNQVGFMVTGIGIGTEMALNGAAAHAFAHIIYKALLLMSAGSVLYMTGKRKCTELGGLFRTMPLTTICGIVGALSISAFPLTSGFVSKSMISEAAGKSTRGRLAPARRGLGRRLPARRHQVPLVRLLPEGFGPAAARSAVEHARRHDLLRRALHRPRARTRAALRDAALPGGVRALHGSHVVFQLQLLLFSGLAFFLMLGWLQANADHHARRGLALSQARRRRAAVARPVGAGVLERFHVDGGPRRADLLAWTHRHHGADGIMARTWPTGLMAFWTTIVLAAFLVLSYL